MAGIGLREECFSHGQFYVTCFRVSSASSLVILACSSNIMNILLYHIVTILLKIL
ncbi:ATP-dependent DNA helicase RRM3-like [Aphis craccivora]|uniref:ATP-dependent DNA helicase RRM3-like n=1 Tax=Aphis craccivora TaxID=307492 RepID=A0A6G0VUM2_APHCR|nr:ATP-dependent DNA helicase RRM3-like [Aphis craccivora]